MHTRRHKQGDGDTLLTNQTQLVQQQPVLWDLC